MKKTKIDPACMCALRDAVKPLLDRFGPQDVLVHLAQLLVEVRASVGAVKARRAGRDDLLHALKACRGNKITAARALGIGPQTLYNRLREFGLDAEFVGESSRPRRRR